MSEYRLNFTGEQIDEKLAMVDTLQEEYNQKILHIDCNFSPEFEIGAISLSNNELSYGDNAQQIRTKKDVLYKVPAGTSFKLSTYTNPVDTTKALSLVVYYSYDDGITYDSASCTANNPIFVAADDAVVVMKMLCSKSQKDTSLSDLIVVNISDMKTAVTEMQPLVKADLNDINLWEKGGIDGTGNEYTKAERIRTKDFVSEAVELIYSENGYVFYVAVYDSNGNYKGFWDGTSPEGSPDEGLRYFNPKGFTGYKYRLMVKHVDNITLGTIDSCNIHFLNGVHKKAFCPQPTLTFIDDDGAAAALANWEALSDEIGVKVTFAINTGVMGDATHATWEEVERLQNKGFEFVSHSHKHINLLDASEEESQIISRIKEDIRNEVTDEYPDYTSSEVEDEVENRYNALSAGDLETKKQAKLAKAKENKETFDKDLSDSVAALREHGCESRYLVYAHNGIDADTIPLVKKHFAAGVGLATGRGNRLPLYTYEISRCSITNTNNKTADGHYPFVDWETLKDYVDRAVVNGTWVIIMTHLRADDKFYYDADAKALIINLCKYAIQKGMTIQTFGEAFPRYKNILESGNIYDDQYYIVDCNGVVHHKVQEV